MKKENIAFMGSLAIPVGIYLVMYTSELLWGYILLFLGFANFSRMLYLQRKK